MKNRKFNWLFIPVHIGALLPILWTVYQASIGDLTANPIQAVTLRTGKTALILLTLTLACTPLYTLTGFVQFTRVRRTLGLYTFFYALSHVLIVLGVDYGFAFPIIFETFVNQRYIYAGLGAFLILLPMAITSFKWWRKKLGKNWKRLHRLIYLATPLAVLHFAWVRKGDIFRLSGDIGQPLLFAAIVAVLLLLRLSFIRRPLVRYRKSILARKRSDGVGLVKSNYRVDERA